MRTVGLQHVACQYYQLVPHDGGDERMERAGDHPRQYPLGVDAMGIAGKTAELRRLPGRTAAAFEDWTAADPMLVGDDAPLHCCGCVVGTLERGWLG